MATVGITGLAGCGGSDDSGDSTTSEDPSGPSGSDGSGESDGSGGSDGSSGGTDGSDSENGGGDFAVNECPVIPGTYTRFDPENGPLPFSFEYPESITPMEYANKEQQTLVTGTFRRQEDLPSEGDVFMDANVNLNPQRNRETWYENRSDRDTLLTRSINGEEVTFIAVDPNTVFSEDQESYSAVGLAPYEWESARESPGPQSVSYHEVSMGISIQLGDDKDVASSCAGNLRTALEQSVESIQMQSGVALFEERV